MRSLSSFYGFFNLTIMKDLLDELGEGFCQLLLKPFLLLVHHVLARLHTFTPLDSIWWKPRALGFMPTTTSVR